MAADYHEHCLWICAVTWSLSLSETHAGQIPYTRTSKYSAHAVFWPQDHFRDGWETGQAFHSAI